MDTGFLDSLGLVGDQDGAWAGNGPLATHGDVVDVHTPIDGSRIGGVRLADLNDYETVMKKAQDAFVTWRTVPAPKRGEIIRLLGLELRKHKKELGALISLEMGKIRSEGEGEVQEAIDICDFAVGLSRQLYGLTMHSERASHRMYEQWHPLGVIGIITAFNFPMAVWAWNAAIAAVCGDTMIWKPSLKTPLTAIAMTNIAAKVLGKEWAPLVSCVIGPDDTVGTAMLDDPNVPLVSATGSTRMGRIVGPRVAQRFGRSLLELGGNNAIIVMDDCDLDLAVRAIVFGAVGTAGQRCTTTRRVLAHKKVIDKLQARLVKAYKTCKIGDPNDKSTLVGPLVDQGSAEAFAAAIAAAKAQGGKVVQGGRRATVAPKLRGGAYVQPTIVRCPKTLPICKEETFAPVLYLIPITSLDEAIRLNNDVPQGLSSAIFTNDVRSAERFTSAVGSDCGIANVNIGTSGAEIGGAFGGEKETGGGRESGSDSWKAYMRRQTQTINWGTSLPLAQGITFG